MLADKHVKKNEMKIEIGIDSFAAASIGIGEDSAKNSMDALAQLLERIERADKVGLDVFGIGEHHRKEFLDSAPTIILAAAAARTKYIKLTSAVTVLSAADPVRVFQNFATLDLISQGRAEMVVGRGSFTEAFPLFGFNLQDYDELFSEKLNKHYIGACISIDRRLHEHNTGHSKFTSTGIPWQLMYTKEFSSLFEAKQFELKIKKMKPRQYIEGLIAQR